MKKTSFSLAAILIALMLAVTGCSQSSHPNQEPASTANNAISGDDSTEAAPGESQSDAAKSFALRVVHGDGTEKTLTLDTDKASLAEALLDAGLVSGTESSMGLFITEVDGETADDSRQEWWCLTKDGEMWNYGASDTMIADGDSYELTLTVGY